MAKVHCLFMGVICSAAAIAAQQGTLSGSTYTVTLADGANLTLNDDDVAALGTSNKLLVQKSDGAAGTGRLEIARDLATAGWDGEVEVTGGNLRVSETGSLGGVTQGTFIREGGQLQLNVSKNKCFNGESFEFCGAGPDGRGALVHEQATQCQYLLSAEGTAPATIKLTGDTTITIKSPSDFRGHAAFDMGGHTLRAKGNWFNLVSTRILNAGDIYFEGAQFGVESISGFSKTSENANDATDMTVYFMSPTAAQQTFRFCNTSSFVPNIVTSNAVSVIHGWGSGTKTISGKVTLNGNLSLAFGDSSFKLKFTGDIVANGYDIYNSKDCAVEFSGKVESPAFRRFGVSNGQVTFGDMGVAPKLTDYSYIGSTDYAEGKLPARVNLNGTYTVTNGDNKAIFIGRASLGGSIEAQRGILSMGEGVAMTNMVAVGMGEWDKNKITGALYQRGGIVYGTSTGVVGSWCDGYYELTDGYLFPGQWFLVGNNCGQGVFVQKGGFVDAYSSDGLMVASGSYNNIGARGHLYLCGGRMKHAGHMQICKTIWGNQGAACRNGYGVFTVDGTASFEGAGASSFIAMAFMSNSVAIVNLNGGRLQTAGLKRAVDGKLEYGVNWPYGEVAYEDNQAYVNFNGGTLKVINNASPAFAFKQYYARERPTRVTVFAGGARFEAETKDFALAAPLNKPEGNGIKSVPFSCSTPWKYVGSPMIEIVGDGYGASAIAEFDSESGTITGVKVTSPGCNYTWAKAKIGYGGANARTEIDLTPELNEKGGGVTVAGTKTVTFDMTNDYEGPTRVEGSATIVQATDGAIPAGSPLELCGGTINLGGRDHAAASLSGTGGKVVGRVTLTNGLVTDAALRRDGVGGPLTVQGRLTFATGAKIVLKNADRIVEGSKRYVVATATDGIVGTPGIEIEGNPQAKLRVVGNSIVAGFQRGVVLFVR